MPKARDRARTGAAGGERASGEATEVPAGAAIAGAAAGVVSSVGRKYLTSLVSSAATDWFDALKAEHASMLAILDRMLATGDGQPALRAQLVMKLKFALTAHAIQEENVVYPALRQSGSAEEADALNSEHAYAKTHAYELENLPKDRPEWLARVLDLRRMLEEHMRLEEKEVFPALRGLLSQEQNARLTALMTKESFKLNHVQGQWSAAAFGNESSKGKAAVTALREELASVLDELPEARRSRIGDLIEQTRQVAGDPGMIFGEGIGALVGLDEGRAALDAAAIDDLSVDWAQSKLLSAPQMAAELGISPATLANWRREGRVVAFKRDRRNYHYPQRQIYRGAVIGGVPAVVRKFDQAEDAWEWLVTPNLHTQGLPPIDRLRSGAEEEVQRAADGALDFA